MYEIFERLVKEKGVSVSDVSRATGISRSLFSDWKAGRTNLKLDKLMKLSSYFGVPLSLFTDSVGDYAEPGSSDLPVDQRQFEIEYEGQADYDYEKAVEAIKAILGVKPQPEGTPVYYKDAETAKLAQEAFENPDLRMLLDASRGLSAEDIRAIVEIAKRMKGTGADG